MSKFERWAGSEITRLQKEVRRLTRLVEEQNGAPAPRRRSTGLIRRHRYPMYVPTPPPAPAKKTSFLGRFKRKLKKRAGGIARNLLSRATGGVSDLVIEGASLLA